MPKAKTKNTKAPRVQVRTPAEKVSFDLDARREFLTGFSRRKKQRETNAKNRALKHEREERQELRGQLRKMRLQQAEANMRASVQDVGPEEDEESAEEDGSAEGSDASTGETSDDDEPLKSAESSRHVPRSDTQTYTGESAASQVTVAPFEADDAEDEDELARLAAGYERPPPEAAPVAAPKKKVKKHSVRPKMSMIGDKKARKRATKKGDRIRSR